MHNTIYVSVFTGALLMSCQAFASDISQESFEERHSGAAVSEINGKIEVGYIDANVDNAPAGGSINGGFVQGAVSIPVGHRFGVQIDAGFADLDGDVQGIGGHFFWRDPSIGLIGIYGHYIDIDGTFNTTQIGAEAELYNEQFSLELFAGQDQLDTVIGDDEFFSGEAVLAFYASENFRISGGIRHGFDQTSGVAGFEYMADRGGVSSSIFADATFGGDVSSFNAGVRFYIANSSKSLIARHR